MAPATIWTFDRESIFALARDHEYLKGQLRDLQDQVRRLSADSFQETQNIVVQGTGTGEGDADEDDYLTGPTTDDPTVPAEAEGFNIHRLNTGTGVMTAMNPDEKVLNLGPPVGPDRYVTMFRTMHGERFVQDQPHVLMATLTANLSLSSTAAAELWDPIYGTWPHNAITVTDSLGIGPMPSGARVAVSCVQTRDDTKYVLLGARGLTLLRLEANLCKGGTSTARLMSTSCASPVTLSGSTVTVCDPINKAFCKGTAAASGNSGGDSQGQANLIWGRPFAGGYAFVNGGTYYRYIEGTLSAGQISTPWKSLVSTITGFDGEFLYGVQAGVSGGGDYITLSGTTCGSPMDAVAYGAVAFDCASYRVIWMCCA